jgi:hypothetical protein
MNRYLILSFSGRKRKKNLAWGIQFPPWSTQLVVRRAATTNAQFVSNRSVSLFHLLGLARDLGFRWPWVAKLASLRVRESTGDRWIQGMHFPEPRRKGQGSESDRARMRFHWSRRSMSSSNMLALVFSAVIRARMGYSFFFP